MLIANIAKPICALAGIAKFRASHRRRADVELASIAKSGHPRRKAPSPDTVTAKVTITH